MSESRPWIERIFWMAAFSISTIGCALLIGKMMDKLKTNPIKRSLAERQSFIREVIKFVSAFRFVQLSTQTCIFSIFASDSVSSGYGWVFGQTWTLLCFNVIYPLSLYFSLSWSLHRFQKYKLRFQRIFWHVWDNRGKNIFSLWRTEWYGVSYLSFSRAITFSFHFIRIPKINSILPMNPTAKNVFRLFHPSVNTSIWKCGIRIFPL